MVDGRVGDLNMDSFSSFTGILSAALVYYLQVGDYGSGMVVGNVVFVNCTGVMTIVFFYCIFQVSAGFSCVSKVFHIQKTNAD